MPDKSLINRQVDQFLSSNSPSTLMAARGVLRFNSVPRWVVYVVIIAVVASWVPLAWAVRSKFTKSGQPRIHLIQDMDNQAKYKAQSTNPFFANEMAARPPIAGTVARGQLDADAMLVSGFEMRDGEVIWADTIPVEVTPELMAKGKELWARYCYLCHGYDGYGNGPVHVRASNNSGNNPRWVAPSSVHDEVRLSRPDGHLYNTVNIGIRNMAGYGHAIPDPEDRWAVVAYLRALQVSQNAPPDLWPQDVTGVPVQPTLVSGAGTLAVLQAEEATDGLDPAVPGTDATGQAADAVEPRADGGASDRDAEAQGR